MMPNIYDLENCLKLFNCLVKTIEEVTRKNTGKI